MAFYSAPYGAPVSYASYGAFPTAFAAPAVSAGAAEGSQAEEAASQHGVSVSGFGAPIMDQGAFYGFPQAYGAFPQATFVQGAPAAIGQTFVHPAATVLPTTLVPVAAPRVRRPGYNERLVAWRNRQKAFNRYKKATKEAIKNANRVQYGAWEQQATLYGGAAPVYGAQPTIIGAPYGAAPYGSTFIGGWGAPAPYLLPYAGEAVAQDAGQQEYAQEFSNYSASAQQEVQQEEPEIRGTQV